MRKMVQEYAFSMTYGDNRILVPLVYGRIGDIVAINRVLFVECRNPKACEKFFANAVVSGVRSAVAFDAAHLPYGEEAPTDYRLL